MELLSSSTRGGGTFLSKAKIPSVFLNFSGEDFIFWPEGEGVMVSLNLILFFSAKNSFKLQLVFGGGFALTGFIWLGVVVVLFIVVSLT